jgi:hypothetical protein
VIAHGFGLDHILRRVGHGASRLNEDEPRTRTQLSLVAGSCASLCVHLRRFVTSLGFCTTTTMLVP